MIVVFSKQKCSKCDDIKGYLESKGHFFTTRDITNDLIMLDKLRKEYPGAGFPVVQFDDITIAGDLETIKNKINTLN